VLKEAVADFKVALETAITSRSYAGKLYSNGHAAKEALIKSQRLILRIHEVVKVSLHEELTKTGRKNSIFPPVGQSNPELLISGFIKAKKQDVVILFDDDLPRVEVIQEGLLAGTKDKVGKAESERSIVVGVRSQLSSVDKNFDTLMERTFAETLNLRLRLPKLVMGEVYLLPVVEYDIEAMRENRVAWESRPVKVDKFIRTFLGISGRKPQDFNDDLYKYERTSLILIDFQKTPPTVFLTLDELKEAGYLGSDYRADFHLLSPQGFASDLILKHRQRHPSAK
jgi:hypothetical protein